MIYIRGIDSLKRFFAINNSGAFVFGRNELKLVNLDEQDTINYSLSLTDDCISVYQIRADLTKSQVLHDWRLIELLTLLLDYRIHNCPEKVSSFTELILYSKSMRIQGIDLSEEEHEVVGSNGYFISYDGLENFYDRGVYCSIRNLHGLTKIINNRLNLFRNDLH